MFSTLNSLIYFFIYFSIFDIFKLQVKIRFELYLLEFAEIEIYYQYSYKCILTILRDVNTKRVFEYLKICIMIKDFLIDMDVILRTFQKQIYALRKLLFYSLSLIVRFPKHVLFNSVSLQNFAKFFEKKNLIE